MFVGHYATVMADAPIPLGGCKGKTRRTGRSSRRFFALGAYFLFAAVAFWLDRKRV